MVPVAMRINVRLLVYLLGIVLLIESAFMALSLLVSIFMGFHDLAAITQSILITGLTGGLSYFLTRRKVKRHPTVREGFLFVSVVWIVISVFGALPYLISGVAPHFIDAYFEAVSGFTTTGASIFTDVEILPAGILFWRALTHWMGGLGIIVMVLVILPSLRVGGIHLFSAETTKIGFEDIHLRVIDTAKRFGLIYLLITALETVVLCIGGMSLFESLCHSFATVATGGFGTRNSSIGLYSPFIQYVIVIFMFLSAINFSLHFLLVRGKIRQVLRNEELRFFALVVSVFTLLCFVVLLENENNEELAFRMAVFQVVSIITTTGFATADYLLWPDAGVFIIFLAMFLGGCAGSTSGGIKAVRHLLMFKNIVASVRSAMHPRMVFTVRYMGATLGEKKLPSLIAFYFWYLIIFFGVSLVIMLLGEDFFTSIGSVATTMAGIGPGLGKVGPAGNFSMLSGQVKIILTFTMLIGRLEIYAFIVLFSPAFWRI